MVLSCLIIMLCARLQISVSLEYEEECLNGSMFFGFCFNECPSGHVKSGNTCVYNNEDIINVEFSQYNSQQPSDRSDVSKVDDYDNAAPIYTSSRGAFFFF